jgi:hypothetical protein
MLTNDTPIVTPENDQFGVDPFARALAKALSEMPSPEGVVVAVNGPWGSGKSSAVNLVVFYSGATGPTGRFNEGFLLRRLQAKVCEPAHTAVSFLDFSHR